MFQVPPVDQLKDIATSGDYTLSGVLLVFACFVCYLVWRVLGWTGLKITETAKWASEHIDTGITKFYQHLDIVGSTMTSLQESLKSLRDALQGINLRLDNMEGKIDNMEGKIDNVSSHVDHLEQQIKKD